MKFRKPTLDWASMRVVLAAVAIEVGEFGGAVLTDASRSVGTISRLVL
jgi:hypothetical protein